MVPAVTAPVPLFQGKAAAKGPTEPGAAAGPVVAAGGGSVRVAVRAKPGARCSAVTGGSVGTGQASLHPQEQGRREGTHKMPPEN